MPKKCRFSDDNGLRSSVIQKTFQTKRANSVVRSTRLSALLPPTLLQEWGLFTTRAITMEVPVRSIFRLKRLPNDGAAPLKPQNPSLY